MNLVGKILIVLICVMSLFFMGITVAVYATHKNWKNVVKNPATGLEVKLQQAEDRNDQLKTEADRLKEDKLALQHFKQQAVAKLELELANTEQQRDDQQRQLTNVVGERDKYLAELKVAQEETSRLRLEILGVDDTGNKVAPGLREEVRTAEAERDKASAELVQKLDELHQAQNDFEALEERSKSLAEQYADAKTVLDMHELQPIPALYEGPPLVDGVVLETGPNDMIVISLGSDDGLLKRHNLEVYRQAEGVSKYLGRIEVTETSPDQAVCKIVRREAPIQRGDRVSSRLR
jgi:hypothetical protein